MPELKYKVESNQVLYFNGVKWLVKETCESEKKAEELLEFLTKSVGSIAS